MRGKGFTLVELLIVIAVVAIIAAAVILNLTGIMPEAKNATAQSDLANIEAAVLTYEAKHYAFPPQDSWEDYLTSESPRLIDRIPEDPWASGGAKYQYFLDVTSTPGTYLILSVGPNGVRNATVGDDQVTDREDDIIVTNARNVS